MTTRPLRPRSHHKSVRGPGGREGAETTADDFLRDHEPLGRDPGGEQERGTTEVSQSGEGKRIISCVWHGQHTGAAPVGAVRSRRARGSGNQLHRRRRQ